MLYTLESGIMVSLQIRDKTMFHRLQNFYKTILAGVVLSALAIQPVFAGDVDVIKKRLTQMIGPEVSQAKITKTDIGGLYQVQVGLTVVYMSADGKFLLNGNLVDLDSNKNLTRQAQAEVRKVSLAKIPKSSLIVYPAKETKHVITVFTDIDCPYCKRLHKEIPKLNEAGVEVRYAAYPRSGIKDRRTGELTESYKTMVSVWCAENPAKVMDDAMVGIPPESKSCDNPVQNHMMQALEMEVNGTPNMIFENGNIIPGFAPAHEILKELKSS